MDKIHKQVAGFSSLGWLLAAVFLFTVIRILYLACYPYPLFADEAQYWFWAQQPDWGYYSKPPMVAWAIALTTGLLGSDGILAVKLASPLAYAVTSMVMYRLATRFEWPEKTALWCALMFLTMPGVTLSSGLISTDPFLLLFWSMFMLCFWEARLTNQWRWWLATGLAGGLGLLSKYNMAFAAAGAGMWALIYQRSLFANVRLYAGAALAGVIFIPNIIWNIRHGMASLKHTGDITQLGEQGSRFHPLQLLEFIGAQAGLLGPVMFIGFIAFLCSLWGYRKDGTVRYLLWLLIPSMLLMLALSFVTRAHGNWAAPALIPASMLAVLWLVERPGLLRLALITHLLVVPVYYLYEQAITRAGMVMHKGIDPFYRLRGWDEAGRQLSVFLDAHPDATLLTDRRKISALMSYYAGPRATEVVAWQPSAQHVQDHFQLTRGIYSQEDRQKPYLLVVPDDAVKIAGQFNQSRYLGRIDVPIHGQAAIGLQVWRVEGWNP
jgi:4-amino-4-deoxy-L-arabinose transferase-like glycosyltransferase